MAPAAETPPRTRSRASPNPLNRASSASEEPRFGKLGVAQQNGKRTQNGAQFVEPPLRTPAPSFHDYPGLARNGVLETMMPLGTRPTSSVKVRTKGDPLRRVVQARNVGGDLILDDDDDEDGDAASPERAVLVSESTRAGMLRSEGQSHRGSPAIEGNFDSDTVSSPSKSAMRKSFKLNDFGSAGKGQAGTPSPSKDNRQDSPTTRLPGGFVHSPVPAGSPYFTAVAMANKNNKPDVQPPLAFLYSAAEQDPELARLLQAATRDDSINDRNSALSQKIKQVKRLYRAQNAGNHRSHTNSLAAGLRSSSGADAPRLDPERTSSLSPSNFHSQTTIRNNKHSSLHNSNLFSDLITSTPHSPRQTTVSLKLRLNNPSKPSDTLNNSRSQSVSTPKPSADHQNKLTRRSSSSSLSSVDSEVANQPTPDMAAKKAAAQARNRGPTETERRQNGTINGAIAKARSPADPLIEARRQRLQEALVPNPPPLESHVRTRTRAHLQPEADRQAAMSQHVNGTAATPAELSSDESDTASQSRKRKEPPTNLGRPPKSQKTTTTPDKPRTKISPIKKSRRNGAVGGAVGLIQPEALSRTNDEIGNEEDSSEESVNNDHCSTCGGKGFLLCCDGCSSSYHLECLHPPVNETDLTGPWHCPKCQNNKEDVVEHKDNQLFNALSDAADDAPPENFRLPIELKTYFRGVSQDMRGNYQKVHDTRNIPASQRSGQNFKSLTDAKGNFILCHGCGQSSDETRDIIGCDYCPLHWHLDCMNPAETIRPFFGYDEKKRRAWMCPAHTEHDLRRMDPIKGYDIPNDDHVLMEGTTSKQRVRVPKDTHIVRTSVARGIKNNGLIEIASDEDSSGVDSDGNTDDEGPDATIWKIPRKGVILDFIYKVKDDRVKDVYTQRTRVREEWRVREAETLELHRLRLENERKLAQDIEDRRFRERLAAYNLARLQGNQPETARYAEDEYINLIRTLQTQAPEPVIAAMEREEEAKIAEQNDSGTAPTNEGNGPSLPSPPEDAGSSQGNHAPLTERERGLLEEMMEQIKRRLQEGTVEPRLEE